MKSIVKLSIVFLAIIFLASCLDPRVKIYEVSFETYGGTIIEPVFISSEDELTLPTPTKPGYTFLGWYLDEAFEVPFEKETYALKTIKLYAKWEQDPIEPLSMSEIMHLFRSHSNLEVTVKAADDVIFYAADGEHYIILEVTDDSNWSHGLSAQITIVKEDETYTQYVKSQLFDGKYQALQSFDLIFDVFKEVFREQILDAILFKNMSSSWFDIEDHTYILKASELETFNTTYFEDGEILESYQVSYQDLSMTIHYVLDGHPYEIQVAAGNHAIPTLSFELYESPAVQGVTDTTIKVGHMLPTSGWLATVGYTYQLGVKTYFDYINSQGGIDGRMIELITYDQTFDEATSLHHTKKLLIEDEVFAFIGHQFGPLDDVERSYMSEIGLPIVGITRMTKEFKPYLIDEAFFLTDTYHRSEAQHILQMITNYTFDGTFDPSKKMGVILEDSGFSNAVTAGLTDYAELNDYDGLVYQYVSSNPQDIDNAVQHLKNANVDAVIITTSHSLLESLLVSMQANRLHKDTYTTARNGNPFSSHRYLDFDVYANAFFNIYTDYEQTTLSSYFDLLSAVLSGTDHESLLYNPFLIQGFQAAYIFVEGLRRLEDKDVTFESFMEAMREAPIFVPFAGFYNYETMHHTLAPFKYNASDNKFYQIGDYVMQIG